LVVAICHRYPNANQLDIFVFITNYYLVWETPVLQHGTATSNSTIYESQPIESSYGVNLDRHTIHIAYSIFIKNVSMSYAFSSLFIYFYFYLIWN